MQIKKLETLEEFQNLKKGDTILVEWYRDPYKSRRIELYEIPMTQHQEDEIICNKRQNLYFNYRLHLANESNTKEVYLIKSEVE